MRVEPRPRLSESDLPTEHLGPRRSGEPDLGVPRETPERIAFFANLATAATRLDAPATSPDAVAGARLDTLRDRFSGPYTIAGARIAAPPMFRMNGGANETSAARHAPELRRIGAQIGVSVEMIRLGQGSPDDLVKVTQALIDRDHLPPGPGDVATRIRRMQWEWGVGVDCAGYTYQAVVAASGTSARSLGLRPLGMENFRALDANRAFTKIDPSSARPGDVMTLDPMPPETVGHNVIVRSHTTAGARHFIEVDSSWGAGPDGADYGGFRRDTWIYDESTKLWTSFDAHVTPPEELVASEGPAGERFHGCYRPSARA